MIHLLEFSTVFVFATINVTVCSCLLIASFADSRLDDLRFAAEVESPKLNPPT